MGYPQLVIFVLALIGAGVACRRIAAARSVFKAIDILIVRILFPAVIFSAIARPERILFGSPVVLACFGLATSAVISAAVITLTRMGVKTGAELALNSCFMNYGYLGFPVVGLLMGEEALPVAALYGVVIGIFHLTVGVAFAMKASGKRISPRLIAGELLAFPPVFAMVVALGLVAFRAYPPSEVLHVLGQLFYPMMVLMLLFVGYNLEFVGPRKYGRELLTAGSIRFIACPFITYTGAVLMGANPVVVKSTLVLSLMPPAIFNLVIAKHFKLSVELSGAMIFYLTLLSLFVVIPVAISLMS